MICQEASSEKPGKPISYKGKTVFLKGEKKKDPGVSRNENMRIDKIRIMWYDISESLFVKTAEGGSPLFWDESPAPPICGRRFFFVTPSDITEGGK